jgi:hypothetical protein
VDAQAVREFFGAGIGQADMQAFGVAREIDLARPQKLDALDGR